MFKDEVVDCGGSRGNVVELLDKGGSVLIGGVDEKWDIRKWHIRKRIRGRQIVGQKLFLHQYTE